MPDPSHPTFRPHLNDEEFAELIQPDDESIQAVVAWLTNHGFQSHHMKWIPHKDWISLEKIPLRKVEYMLNTTYSIYQDQDGEQIVRTEEYSLPELLHPHIELIQVSIHSEALCDLILLFFDIQIGPISLLF